VRIGKPLEHVKVADDAAVKRRELYRMPDGKTVLLRTNVERALMSKADGPNSGDIMGIEKDEYDFIGLAVPSGPGGAVDCFLIPKFDAIEILRTSHRNWQQTQRNGGNSLVRMVSLDDEKVGALFERFRIKAEEVRVPSSTTSNLDVVIAEARRTIAQAANKPE